MDTIGSAVAGGDRSAGGATAVAAGVRTAGATGDGVVQAATVSAPQSTLHQESLSNGSETCLDDTEVSADEQCIENGIAGNALGDTDA